MIGDRLWKLSDITLNNHPYLDLKCVGGVKIIWSGLVTGS